MTDYDTQKVLTELAELVNAGQMDRAVTQFKIELGLSYSAGQFDARESMK